MIHDIASDSVNKLIREKFNNAVILSPDGPIKPCVGCLGCWLKTPGTCVLDDGYCHMGREISRCDKMVFISRCCYGGFSPFVKNVIDRSISYMLPLFKKQGKLSRHYRRYDNKIECAAYFYGNDITDEEKQTAQKLVSANAMLWDCTDYELVFCNSAQEAAEEIL